MCPEHVHASSGTIMGKCSTCLVTRHAATTHAQIRHLIADMVAAVMTASVTNAPVNATALLGTRDPNVSLRRALTSMLQLAQVMERASNSQGQMMCASAKLDTLVPLVKPSSLVKATLTVAVMARVILEQDANARQTGREPNVTCGRAHPEHHAVIMETAFLENAFAIV